MSSWADISEQVMTEYMEVWVRLAHYDTLCKGEFEHVEGNWYVCPRCGMSFERRDR
jgi:hypothetical protein